VLTTLLIVLGGWAAAVLAVLVVAGRTRARRLLAYGPWCLTLVRRLSRDPELPRRTKLLVGLLVGYLALPFDLIPDFIPVAGQLDDLVIAVLVLRAVVRACGDGLLARHWPGPPDALATVRRLAV
jgi:uncharacterized membrane protein YkvA (DUF1232 family)